MENNTNKDTKKKNNKIWLVVIVLLAICLGGGYYAYTQGLLDQYLNKTNETVNRPDGILDVGIEGPTEETLPEGYTEPTITFKDGVENNRIIIKEGETFNARNFVSPHSFNGRGNLITDLVGVEDTKNLDVGVYSGFLTYRDFYKHEVSVEVSVEVLPEETTEEEIEEIKKKTGHWEERTEVIPAHDEKVIKTKSWTEKVLVKEAYDETIVVPAWDEQKLVTPGYYNPVLVREAWDEPVTYCSMWGYDKVYMYICGGCGARFTDVSSIYAHIDASNEDQCGSYSGQNVSVGDRHCLQEVTEYDHHPAEYRNEWVDPVYETVHHPEETKTVHHQAEYKDVYHEAEYETKHIEAVTRTYKVWVED